jgi:hypothetical protein
MKDTMFPRLREIKLDCGPHKKRKKKIQKNSKKPKKPKKELCSNKLTFFEKHIRSPCL